MEKSDGLGIGLYSMVEATRLLRTPRRTLSRWVEGYVLQLRGGRKAYAPLIQRNEGADLTFGDLVELLYVRSFRDAGVPLREIRRAAAKYRKAWKVAYPLATKRFATDGRSLHLEEGDIWHHALTGQRRLLLGDLSSEWRPLGKNRAVVLDPRRAFGKPIDDISGAHTYILAQAYKSGESPSTIAWWYDTTEAAALDAARFEREWSDSIEIGATIA